MNFSKKNHDFKQKIKPISKKTLLLAVLIFVNLIAKAQTFVPDDIFEQRLIDLGYDDVLDNFVDTANINTVTSLGVGGGVEDFTGLEDFTALEVLDCSNNFITTISFSTLVNLKELEISLNPFLNSIDISNNI